MGYGGGSSHPEPPLSCPRGGRGARKPGPDRGAGVGDAELTEGPATSHGRAAWSAHPGFFNISGSSWLSFSPALFAGSRRRWGGGRLFGPDGRALPWAPHLEHWLEAETCGAAGTTEGCASGHFVLPHVCPARVGSLWGHSEPRTPFLLLRSTVTQVEVRLWTRKNIRGDLGRCRARSVWARYQSKVLPKLALLLRCCGIGCGRVCVCVCVSSLPSELRLHLQPKGEQYPLYSVMPG